jgi:prepilin-type N-terminal cleavage/methylation domain-containing protein
VKQSVAGETLKHQRVRGTGDRRNGFSLLEVLMVVGISTVVAAIAVPMMKNTIGDFKLSGDARGLTNAVSLAKLRAASDFSQSRLYVDRNARSYHVEVWSKTAVPPDWVTEGGIVSLSSSDIFGFSVVGAAPPNTQGVFGQAPPCLTRLGAAIANTSCILFNSRGIPVDSAGVPPAVGAPTGNDAIYITDNTAVFGGTISATGLIKLWRTNPLAVPAWVLQ